MSITNLTELEGMKKISEVVATALREMRLFARPGMSTKQLDEYGSQILRDFGAKSAPKETYQFPGWTCISVNNAIAHGIPSDQIILQEGDLVNIDVSAELDGFWSDNGGSFVLGNDVNQHQNLVNTSKRISKKAINKIRGGVRISDIGRFIEREAKNAGYRVIKNLTGHGIGRSLHEEAHEIANFCDHRNRDTFQNNTIVAVETFISTKSTMAFTAEDGWTLIGNKGGYVAQHEHTILITSHKPIILTKTNNIWT